MSIEEILDKASGLKIAVIGDYIVDRYINGDVTRVSPEAPVVVLNQKNVYDRPGGAANVWMNLQTLGVKESYLFTMGDKSSWDDRICMHKGVPSVKTRVVSGGHHIVRIDNDCSGEPILYDDLSWREDIETLIPRLDCLIFSDYHKGMLTKEIVEVIKYKCHEHKVSIVVDAKKDFGKYIDVDIIKCNQHEFHQNFKNGIPDVFYRDMFVVTYGANGIGWFDSNMNFFGINGEDVKISDTCGAGDTVTAMLSVLSDIPEVSSSEMIAIANKAAAESCRHPGVYPIKREDLIK